MTMRAVLGLVALSLAAAPAHARTLAVARHASLTLVGEHRSDLAGASVAGAGDVDGDGRPDLIVGAPLADPQGRADAGAAYVVFGGCAGGALKLGALGRCGYRVEGAAPLPPGMRHSGWKPSHGGAGDVVAGVGDVNGDGLADVAVSGRESAGSTVVYVVFGKRDNAPVDLAALGEGGFVIRSGAEGLTVVDGRPAGDVNGDGLSDVAVRTGIDGDEDAGSFTVVLGRRDATPIALGTQGTAGAFRVSGQLSGMSPASRSRPQAMSTTMASATCSSARRALGASAARSSFSTERPRRRAPGSSPAAGCAGTRSDGPRAAGGFGWSLAPLGAGGSRPPRAGAPSRGLHGAGGAWILPKRAARPLPISVGTTVASVGRLVLLLAHGRADKPAAAWLCSRAARRQVTYSGLRNAREARVSGAAAGGGAVVLGSPGDSRAYVERYATR